MYLSKRGHDVNVFYSGADIIKSFFEQEDAQHRIMTGSRPPGRKKRQAFSSIRQKATINQL